MKNRKRRLLRLVPLFIATVLLAGCASSQSAHGVEIKKSRSYNPLTWF